MTVYEYRMKKGGFSHACLESWECSGLANAVIQAVLV